MMLCWSLLWLECRSGTIWSWLNHVRIHSFRSIKDLAKAIAMESKEKPRVLFLLRGLFFWLEELSVQVWDLKTTDCIQTFKPPPPLRPSVTTNEIDKAVHQMIIDAGAYPSPLGYDGFPKSVCTLVNECMCHGIPDSRQLQNGDIINIDVTVYLNGYHGDTSKTFFCGEVSGSLKNLVKVTEECLERGIGVCKDGAPFKKIGKTIRK